MHAAGDAQGPGASDHNRAMPGRGQLSPARAHPRRARRPELALPGTPAADLAPVTLLPYQHPRSSSRRPMARQPVCLRRRAWAPCAARPALARCTTALHNCTTAQPAAHVSAHQAKPMLQRPHAKRRAARAAPLRHPAARRRGRGRPRRASPPLQRSRSSWCLAIGVPSRPLRRRARAVMCWEL